MIEKTTRRADDNCETLPQLSLFFLRIFTAHNSRAEHVVEKLEQLLHLNFDLCAQLARGTEYNAVSTFVSADFLNL